MPQANPLLSMLLNQGAPAPTVPQIGANNTPNLGILLPLLMQFMQFGQGAGNKGVPARTAPQTGAAAKPAPKAQPAPAETPPATGNQAGGINPLVSLLALLSGLQSRQAGGPVRPGGNYLVGEAGPEKLSISPTGQGNITPINQASMTSPFMSLLSKLIGQSAKPSVATQGGMQTGTQTAAPMFPITPSQGSTVNPGEESPFRKLMQLIMQQKQTPTPPSAGMGLADIGQVMPDFNLSQLL
jgi:hypothetical protein